jgi:hypothetical protein
MGVSEAVRKNATTISAACRGLDTFPGRSAALRKSYVPRSARETYSGVRAAA